VEEMEEMDKMTESKEKKKVKPGSIILFIVLVIIGLLLLILTVWGIIIVLRIIANGVVSLFQSFGKLDAVIIVALISAAISIIGFILNSVVSNIITYRNNRREYLTQKREEPYGKFVDMVYKLSQESRENGSYTERDMIKDTSDFSRQLTLWGSPKVTKGWIKFRENCMKQEMTTEDSITNLFIMESIMNEMRKDLGVGKTKRGDLLGFFINDIKKFKK